MTTHPKRCQHLRISSWRMNASRIPESVFVTGNHWLSYGECDDCGETVTRTSPTEQREELVVFRPPSW